MKEKGRLEAAREGERDLCMCHGPHRVLLCSALIEFVCHIAHLQARSPR